MKIVDEFKNGGEFVYDSSVDSGDVENLSDPTAFKDTMTVQAYDQYGDKWDEDCGVYSCGKLDGNNLGAWMDQGTGTKNPYDDTYKSLINPDSFCTSGENTDKAKGYLVMW